LFEIEHFRSTRAGESRYSWIVAKAKLQLVPSPPRPDPALVDEFGELDRKVQAFKPTADRHKWLKEKILGFTMDTAASEPATFLGSKYSAIVGAQQMQRSIESMAKVYKLVGKDRFLDLCSMTLKALEHEVGEIAAAQYIQELQTGPRKVTVILSMPIAA
jgi:hypothetical protein